MSNAFEKWRYCFEGNNAPAFDINFLSAFANAAIYMMFHLGYNAFSKPSNSTKTDEEIEKMLEDNRNTNYQKSLNYVNKYVNKKEKGGKV